MPKKIIFYEGWIGAKPSDLAALEALGAEVSTYNYDIGAFDRCSIPESAYPAFVRKWKGYRVWGMVRRWREVYTEEEMADVPF